MDPKQLRAHLDMEVSALARLAGRRRETWFRWEANPPKNWDEIKNKLLDSIVYRVESARDGS